MIITRLINPTAVSTKVVDAIRAGHYVPYTKLTVNARLAASMDQDHLTISTNGKLVVSTSLNRGDERQISFMDWSLAADVMTDKVKDYRVTQEPTISLCTTRT